MPLLLSYEDVRSALSMADAVEAIEAAHREQADGQALASERVNQKLPNGWVRLMAAGLFSSGVVGYKEFHMTRLPQPAEVPAEVRYGVTLFDYTTGLWLASMDAYYLTAIRTGATAGVAAKYLAPPDASSLGIIGSGSEARMQIEAMAAVRPIKRAKVYSRSAERREAFAREMGDRLGIDLQPVDDPRKTIEDADILAVATNTGPAGPALFGSWLRPGLHVSSIGSTMATQREIDHEVWARADWVVLDTRRLLQESGDALVAKQHGTLDEAKLVELSEVVAGKAPGRSSPEQTTLYKSVGTGIQDVAVAYCAYRRARELGLGQEVQDYLHAKPAEGT